MEYKNILVVVEMEEDSISLISKEMIAKARLIADELNEKVIVLTMCHELKNRAKTSIENGADKVVVVENDFLKNYTTNLNTKILSSVIDDISPRAVLIPSTPNGRDLGGRLSARKQLGLVADCTDIKTGENKRFKWIRPTFDGKLLSAITLSTTPEIATIGEGVFKGLNPNKNREGEIVYKEFDISEKDILTEILNVVKKSKKSKDLEEAEIIVSGGLGLKEPKNFHLIQDLAEVLDAQVSGSKPLADQLWIPANRYVGVSGLKVTPKLYIAIGISGAMQHLIGMRDSDIIIAINNDKNADIFNVAHYCIVADLFEFVPKLTEKLKEIKLKKY